MFKLEAAPELELAQKTARKANDKTAKYMLLVAELRQENLGIHTYIPAYLYACIHTYMHTYIPTYIHSYIHTYIHTYHMRYNGQVHAVCS